MSQGDEFKCQRGAATNAEQEQGTEGGQKREHADVAYAGFALSLELLTTLTAIEAIKPRQAVGVLSGAIGVLHGMDDSGSAAQSAAIQEAIAFLQKQIPAFHEQLDLPTH